MKWKKIPLEVQEITVSAPKEGEILVIMVPGASQEDMVKFKDAWNTTIKEGGSKAIFFNNKVEFKIVRSNGGINNE